MRAPSTEHWRQYHGAIAVWVGSQADASGALRAAAAAERWLGEYPEQAADIQRLALSGAALAVQRQQWESTKRIAAVGLDAAAVRPLATAEDLASATQLCFFAARAAMQLNDALGTRILLERATTTLERMEQHGALTNYLLFQKHSLAGELAESSLEDLRAAEEFTRALELGEPLRNNRRLARELETVWGPLLFGETARQQPRLTQQLLSIGFSWIFNNALLGRARTGGDTAAAREAIAVCVEEGLPVGRRVLALHRVILNLAADEIDPAVAACLDQARRLDEPLRSAWAMALSAGQASAYASRAESDRAAEVLDNSFSARPATFEAIAVTLWFGAQVTVQFGKGAAAMARETLRTFLVVYRSAIEQLAGGPTDLPFRAACEAPFAAAIEDAFERCAAGGDAEARRDLVVLLDALREPEQAPPTPSEEGIAENKSLEFAADKLARVAHALRGRPGTVALIVQAVGAETLFLCATNDTSEPLTFTRGGADVGESMAALSAAAEKALRAEKNSDDNLKRLGKSAFRVMPETVRARLAAAKTILFVPDFSAGRDRLPFELFHDGKQFLGLGKSVARCLSIANLVAVTEAAVLPRPLPRRALCVAVPDVPGLEPLRFAESEVDTVAIELRQDGWDVEVFRPTEATPQAFLEVAPLTGILHVATHGEASAGAESLVLADGARLGAIEVMRSRHGLRGLVFLNACSLARGRYLGGGVSRGMALAFARAGAPSVIANLLPVEDRRAASLAREFYRNAKSESVGEALRRAREAMAENSGAALWSTSVLLGSPFLRLDGSAPGEPDATCRLFGEVEVAPASRLTSARAALKRDAADSRLAGAIAWTEAMRSRAENKPLLQLARLARDLGHSIGEAHCLQLLATALRSSGDRNATAVALRALVDALARLRGVWPPAYEAHREADAELRALDPTYEPRTLTTVRLESGLSINDQSDPAVAAILGLQAALDEHAQRWRGEPSLRAPERTVADAAWNAIVWGYRFRVYGTGGEIGYAAQLAARLVWRELVPAAAQTNLQRILGGVLPFLWGKQRVTHLDHWLARAHADVVRLAIDSVNRHWVPPETSPAAPLAAEALTMLEDALGGGAATPASKYARARAALAGGEPSGVLLARLKEQLKALIERCRQKHPDAAADLAAWVIGLVAEQENAVGRQDQVLALRSISADFAWHAEDWLMNYLNSGFEEVRATGGLDLLARWSMAEL